MTSLRHTVAADAPSLRLDQYLTSVVPQESRAQIQRLIEKGHVRVSGRIPKASHRVVPGEEIQIEIPAPEPLTLKPEPIPLKVIYEDRHLLIVDKPAGLVVHPAPGHPSGTLVNALLGRGKPLSSIAGAFKPGIVHRLDKDTSGLLVVAKENPTHRSLSRQFASGKVNRVYLAYVQGRVPQDEGTIEAPIGRHPIHRQRMAVRFSRSRWLEGRGAASDSGSRRAVTRYKVVKRFADATLLELHPQTGRTHQLRVHCAHLGHPILGDARYGVRGRFPRQALHAHRLGFEHPRTRRWMEFLSPVPEDLQQMVRLLKVQ